MLNIHSFLQKIHNACDEGDKIKLQKLLQAGKTKKLISDQEMEKAIEDAFLNACKLGHLDIVKYLTSSLEFENPVNVTIRRNFSLDLAIDFQQYEIIDYLINSPELIEHVGGYFTEAHDNAINHACQLNDLPIIKLLLTSENFKEQIDFHGNDDEAFKILWNRADRNMEIINFLLFDYKILITDHMRHIVHWGELSGNDEVNNIVKIFDSCELQRSLSSELKESTVIARAKI